MRITLVTTSFNDMVHGTFNDKKTGCGINLLKPDTASRFTRAGDMTYLGEITCEKCKAKIAKEMIKADSKEMKALLKEEKMRAKRGLEDEGLVALADLEVRPTSRPVDPEPRRPREIERPAPPPPPVNPNANVNRDNPAYTDDLSQFAIEKPVEPQYEAPQPEEDDILKQFAIEKPEPPQYEPPQSEEDDILKQFAIEKPEPPQYETPQEEDDFLKQFSYKPEEPQYGYQPEPPVQPPVIDDISDAISAMQNNTYNQPVEEETVNNDILSMFAVENPQKTNDYNSYEDDESIYDSMKSDDTTENSNENEWDIIANQLFADTTGNAKQPQPQQPAFDDISVPEIEDIVSPKLDDISIDDIIAPTKNMNTSLNDVSIDDILASAKNLTSQPVQQPQAMTPPPVQPVQQPQAMTPPPVQPVQQPQAMTPPPVQPVQQPQAMTPPPVQPVQQPQAMTPPPVQPVQQPQAMTPPPVQPQAMPQMTPPPVVQPQAMPQMQMPQMTAAIGQIITVPQISGYDQNGQPMYAYAQMLVQGYDPNGQPILMPIPTQPIMGMQMPTMAMPAMTAPQQPEYSSLDKNSRLQAVLASLDEPVAEKDMTVGQKIAAANAAKGSPVSANVSKIATNEHSKSANQAFINAISESKEATQSLTETQGIKPKGVVLDSIEDVLSQLGDNSLKEQKAAQQARMQQNVPVFDEYKGPTSRRPSSSSFSRPVPTSRPSSSSMSDMPLTRAQMKEKKKQDKIDAKFQKEMAKRQK